MATPLFANLSSLIGLNREHGIDVNPTLLRVLADLYVQKPSHPEGDERQFVEMIRTLIDRVDDETAAIVARKLRAHPGLSPVIARMLDSRVQTSAPPVATAAVSEAPAIAAPAAPASESDPEHFLAADPEERWRILADLDQSEAAGIHPPSDAPATIRALETLALSGRPGDFIREIERGLALPRAIAQRIVNDPSGEPTVVVAKALGMPIEVLQRILLFVNPSVGQSVRRVFDLTALYDRFSRAAALRLVALWRDSAPAARSAPLSSRQPPAGARDAAAPAARPSQQARPPAQQTTRRQSTT